MLLSASVVIHSCDCNKDNCLRENYSFGIYCTGVPDRDSIFINDTIWFDIAEPTTLKDLITNQFVSFNNVANLSTVIGLNELLGNSQVRDAVADFDYILIFGTEINSTNPARFKEYVFNEEGGQYKFRLGIVPKRTGIFRIGFSDAANVYRKTEECTKAYFKILFKQTNQHLYYNDQNFGIITPLPSNMYCFKVK